MALIGLELTYIDQVDLEVTDICLPLTSRVLGFKAYTTTLNMAQHLTIVSSHLCLVREVQ